MQNNHRAAPKPIHIFFPSDLLPTITQRNGSHGPSFRFSTIDCDTRTPCISNEKSKSKAKNNVTSVSPLPGLVFNQDSSVGVAGSGDTTCRGKAKRVLGRNMSWWQRSACCEELLREKLSPWERRYLSSHFVPQHAAHRCTRNHAICNRRDCSSR